MTLPGFEFKIIQQQNPQMLQKILQKTEQTVNYLNNRYSQRDFLVDSSQFENLNFLFQKGLQQMTNPDRPKIKNTKSTSQKHHQIFLA